MSIPILDLSLSQDPEARKVLLSRLRDVLFNIGFLYIKNHEVPQSIISNLESYVPSLFGLSTLSKSRLSKLNSPHFLGYTGFAEESTMGKPDQREQFDFATELDAVYQQHGAFGGTGRDFSRPYWGLRGPNQWPAEEELPGFKEAVLDYHDAVSALSYKFVHLVEEAFGIEVGTFDHFFGVSLPQESMSDQSESQQSLAQGRSFLCPQHRLKLAKYPATNNEGVAQGLGPHKDTSGWLTFLYQVGNERGLEVLSKYGDWMPADPVPGTFVVNFGSAFEAATEGAVRATVHRVLAPTCRDRYSIPFFMGLPLDLKLSEIRSYIPEQVRSMRRQDTEKSRVENMLPSFLDPRWDSLGESTFRKWIRSYPQIGIKWYGAEVVEYYTKETE